MERYDTEKPLTVGGEKPPNTLRTDNFEMPVLRSRGESKEFDHLYKRERNETIDHALDGKRYTGMPPL